MSETTHRAERPTAWQAPSLRGRIALLASSVVLLMVFTLGLLIWVLHTTQANIVSRSEKHLNAVAQAMAGAYETRTDRSILLGTVDDVPPPPPGALTPLPHPVPRQNGPPPPGEMPPRPREPRLEALTAKVLQDETGIEGGFYRPRDQRLIGYAFPTHEGPGDPKALPARETPDIIGVASAAVSERTLQQKQFYGNHDVVLFMATPVCETRACEGGPVGSAWLMQRLPGAETDRRHALLWSIFGLGAVACITVLLAFLVLRRVGQGTEAVLDRLTLMEVDLNRKDHPEKVRLAEFHRVLDGLDRLGDTLRSQIDKERELQSRVRQNERLASMGQLAASVAHELRNPLATVRLRAQMAQRKTQEATTSQACAVILAEVDRLDAMIERMLDFSRPIRINRAHANISELARSAVQRWAMRYPAVTVSYLEEGNICAAMDEQRLDQVFDNLLENASQQLLERRPANPLIQVRCSKDEDGVMISIFDNGGGFTRAALKSATEPFYTTRAKGTGLGLAITQEIIHALGGTMDLCNREDGALIRIYLPDRESC